MALKNFQPRDEFFEKILRASIDDDNSIYNVECIEQKPATMKGQNYMSNMTRLSLKYTCNSEDNSTKMDKFAKFIVKEEPTELESLKMTKDMYMFTTESLILRDILPKISDIVGKQFGPKYIYGSDEPTRIVMEDLSINGFKIEDQTEGLSKLHTLMVIETLAKLHAGSIALNEKEQGSLQSFHRGRMSPADLLKFCNGIENDLRAICQEIRKWSDDDCTRAIDKLEKFTTINIALGFRKCFEFRKNEFHVLTHGDCWTNNIMFRNNEHGEPVDIRFVDYQLTAWVSPSFDLLYFLCICPQVNVKVNEHDLMLEHYLKTLTVTMDKINCIRKPPTMEELRNSMKIHRIWAFFSGLIFFPKIANSTVYDSWEDSIKRGLSDGIILKNPVVIERMKKIIPWMDKMGYLELFE